MTRRGLTRTGAAQDQIDALMAKMREALANGSAADSAEVMALQAQIDAVNAKAEQAEATGQNARDMIIRRDPALRELQELAASLGDAREAGNAAHEELGKRIDAIQLTPGQPGRDGADGAPGKAGLDGRNGTDGQSGKDGLNGSNGRDGSDGLSAYQLARQQGYGGSQAQWIASLKGDKGHAGQQGQPGTPADMTRVTALEQQKLQIEYRDGIAVPAVVSLLGLSATTDVAVTWSTAFPDTAYTIVKPQVSTTSASLIGKTDAVVKAGTQTRTGCTVTVTTTAILAAGTCTLGVLAYRKG